MSHLVNPKRMGLIRSGSPVPLLGLTFYPILMKDYDEFIACKDAITLRLGTLPVKYLAMDYFSAIFAFEIDTMQATKKAIGLFSKVIRMLQLSLRIDCDNEEFSKWISYGKRNDEICIDHIEIHQDEKTVCITPSDISGQIRGLIADLNGLELPDEGENLDLVIANEQKKEFLARGQKRLKHSINDLISSVAYHSRCRESEVLSWTVREFEARRSAIDRDKRYMLYGQAEMGGMVTFKNGNPAPSWCYEVYDDSLGTQSLSELQFGDAKQKSQ